MKTVDPQKPFFHVLLIILLGLIAYSNTFHASFHFDDEVAILENPIIKDLRFFIEPSRAEVFKGHFEYNTFKNRYIGYLTFALNYKLHGLNVAGYHILNLLIHIGNGLLVYLLVILTFKTPFLHASRLKSHSGQIAVFTALLFVCHPIQTQAVTYIFQRVASLATMFYLLSLVAYIKWRLKILQAHGFSDFQRGNKKSLVFYLISILAAVLAMKTKEIAFMLPFTAALYELIFFKDKLKRKALYLFPLILTLVIIPLTLLNIDIPFNELIDDVNKATKVGSRLSRTDYLVTQIRVIVTYIRLIIFPIRQNLDYDYPLFHSLFHGEVLSSLFLLLTFLGFGVYLLFRYRHSESCLQIISFGIIWFFINLALESSFIPLMNIIFEHRIYLPSIGVILAFTTTVFLAAEKLKDRGKNIAGPVYGILIVITVLLTWSTYQRNFVWMNEMSLWKDVVRKSPDNARAHNNLGNAYRSRGLIGKAIDEYLFALKLDPAFQVAHYNLGHAYQFQTRFDKAVEHYSIAIQLNPADYDTYNNLGNTYRSMGLMEEAIKNYEIALKLKPYSADPHINLGNVYMSQGFADKAVEQYKLAIQLDPLIASAYYNLGLAYASQGHIDKAIEQYQTVITLKPDYSAAHYNLSVAYRAKGFISKANEHYETASRLREERTAHPQSESLLKEAGGGK